MKDVLELYEYLDNFGYLKISKETVYNNLSVLINDNNLLVLKSSSDTTWIIKEDRFLPKTEAKFDSTNVSNNININLIRSYKELKKNIPELTQSLDLFRLFLNEGNVVFLSDYIDINHSDFKLLESKNNLRFHFSNVGLIRSRTLETDVSVYILHDHSKEKSNLYYQYSYYKNMCNKKIRIISYELKNFELTLALFDYENFTFVEKSVRIFKLCNFLISKENTFDILSSIDAVNSYEVFPQADNFKLIWDIFDNLEDRTYTRKDISALMTKLSGGIVDRQISYYLSALLYLNLLNEPETGNYHMSFSALRAKQQGLLEQVVYLVRSILRHEVFNNVFREYLSTNIIPSVQMISELIKNTYTFDFKDSTALRRATTVRSWIAWIIDKTYYND